MEAAAPPHAAVEEAKSAPAGAEANAETCSGGSYTFTWPPAGWVPAEGAAASGGGALTWGQSEGAAPNGAGCLTFSWPPAEGAAAASGGGALMWGTSAGAAASGGGAFTWPAWERQEPPPPLERLEPPCGALWYDWNQRNLVNNALSLGGALLTRAGLRRLSEANEALQRHVLRVLVGDERQIGEGGTRLHHAAIEDRVERARALLAAGANPAADNRHRESPLEVSARKSESGAVGVLLARDEAVYPLPALQQAAEWRGLLRNTAWGSRPLLMDALLARGVHPDTRYEHQTALHWATRDCRVLRLLLDAGAEVDPTERIGVTPLFNATLRGEADAVRLLLDAGAAVNHRNRDGSTALWYACDWDQLEVAQLLHARGADPRIPGKDGETPLQIARRKGHGAVVAWLEALPAAAPGPASAATGGGGHS